MEPKSSHSGGARRNPVALMHEHISRFRVHAYEVNAFGELGTSGLLRLMQQTASDASAAIGFPLDWYDRNGTVWIIRRTSIERLAAAAYGDEIAVRTWVSDIRRVRSQREYALHREPDGALLARGSSDWVYVDSRRAAPARIPRELQQALMPDGVVAHERPPRKPPDPPPGAFHTRRRVQFAELDSVAHVNNANYADYIEQDLYDALDASGWSLDPLGREGRLSLRHLDLEYLEPAQYADRLDGLVWVTHIGDGRMACQHTLQRNGHRVVHASTEWQWHGGEMPASLQEAARALRA